MERNHIIGFVLIFGLLLVWTFVNGPSKEEQAAMQQRQDSLNRVEILKDSITKESIETEQAAVPLDSAALANQYGSFATAVVGTGETVRLDNEFFTIDCDSKGGKISKVEMKKYKKVKVDDKQKEYKVPLFLLDDPKDVWDITIPAIQGELHTADLLFEPKVEGNKITFTATGTQGAVGRGGRRGG